MPARWKFRIGYQEIPAALLLDTGGVYGLCAEFDNAYANLIRDLKQTKSRDGNSTLLEKTFVLALGEFGRTQGTLSCVPSLMRSVAICGKPALTIASASCFREPKNFSVWPFAWIVT